MRILVADDEPEMTMVLEALLNREHYSVDVVCNGQDALDFGLSTNYDCIVLDIMMPKLDGIQTGLNSGADDYLPKPFDNREFIARVRALTRRGGEYTPTALTAGNVTLDCAAFELKCGGSRVRLGNREFQMLELLMRQEGRLISTEQFMEHIWGYDSEAEINVVWAYISYLRRKLEAVGANVRIVARRGQGYLLEESI